MFWVKMALEFPGKHKNGRGDGWRWGEKVERRVSETEREGGRERRGERESADWRLRKAGEEGF